MLSFCVCSSSVDDVFIVSAVARVASRELAISYASENVIGFLYNNNLYINNFVAHVLGFESMQKLFNQHAIEEISVIIVDCTLPKTEGEISDRFTIVLYNMAELNAFRILVFCSIKMFDKYIVWISSYVRFSGIRGLIRN